jgi:hypothetical protein
MTYNFSNDKFSNPDLYREKDQFHVQLSLDPDFPFAIYDQNTTQIAKFVYQEKANKFCDLINK